MAATTTAFNNLISKLVSDFPALTFAEGDDFHWSPTTQTVWYVKGSDDNITLLHETAHGLLDHIGYKDDIELLKLERAAWEKAAEIAKIYKIAISQDDIESALDTYRDWLHTRSLCPNCQQNGLQVTEKSYRCVVCNQKWHVNDARHCGLRRRKIP